MTAELSRIVAESAIRDLLCEYTHLIDQGRLREVAALFAQSDYGQCGPDGVATTVISSDADAVFAACNGFIRMYDDPPIPRTKHLLTNTRISVDGESATALSYVTVIQGIEDLALQPILSGRYFDRFTCVDGTWQFSSRLFCLDNMGDMSAHAKRAL
ncbi:nuclear transport factor 2 family protein [Rhodococcus sp. IEGM 1409]|uniref:nuclear transport factor 2 family protein n=1 Tax=Rhodococcus sp. IEGM 1409 TaxID=3047082 RepID=UPI0024B82CCC|nr:nuclear transport factor 2 family protein [Rhodococcus sp. IEGM 1409]MDI9899275.1 nuclear transport factor 2 family protein [Rhodococcus sp. IEGM 1409]